MAHVISRRRFLQGSGAILIAVSGGLVVRAATSGVFSTGTGPAYTAWESWRSGETPELRMVGAAILVSNPHNSQPWLFQVRDRQIDLFADTTRTIGTIDPFLREMHLGLGCAITNLSLAAQAEGFTPNVTLLPTPNEPTHVATISLTPAVPVRSPLYLAIPSRHTDRGAYDTARPVERSLLDQLASQSLMADVMVQWLTDPAEMERFRTLTLAATAAIIADAQQSSDSFQWQRHTWSDLQERRDGLTYDVQGMGALTTSVVKMLPSISQAQADEGWLAATRDRQLPTSAAFGLLLVADRLAPIDQLRAGMRWQELHLQLTHAGLVAQPLSQTAERTDRELQLGLTSPSGVGIAALVRELGREVVMGFRIGYPTAERLRSPRRAIADVVIA